MATAIALARRGSGKTSPNPAVGCVIVKNGRVISSGFHKKVGRPHAEREALDKIVGAPSLRGATLYISLEPCCHYGRTPPCTDAIIQSGIRRIVVGMRDPDRRVRGKGIRILKKAGTEVKVGVLEEECRKLNEAYLVHRIKKRPYVILKAAITLNSVVGLKTKKWGAKPLAITGSKAGRFSHHLRSKVDAILVGSGTIVADDPQLTCRLKNGRDPLRIVLDSSLKLRASSRVFNLKSAAKTVVATTVSKIPKRKGVEFLLCRRDQHGGIELKDLLRQLADRGVMTVLVEGGPKVWNSFLKSALVDRLYLLVANKIVERNGIQIPLNEFTAPLKSIEGKKLGQDLLIEGDYRESTCS